MRHGETTYNRDGRFTGWVDEGLTDLGRVQATEVGRALALVPVRWSIGWTSRLRRATETAAIALAQFANPLDDVRHDWRLNERHVGELEGISHAEAINSHGQAAFEEWRWGTERPPPMQSDDPRQRRHGEACPEAGRELPWGESLLDVMERVQPWLVRTRADLALGMDVVAFTHGTTMRALCVLLEERPAKDVFSFRPPNGRIALYEQDGRGRLSPTV